LRDLDRDLDGEPLPYGPRPAFPTKLEAHKPIIEARPAAYPELSAIRLLDEIRAAGVCRWLHAAASMRPAGASDAAVRARDSLRNARAPPSAVNLRLVMLHYSANLTLTPLAHRS
jgi:hypothetical protein